MSVMLHSSQQLKSEKEREIFCQFSQFSTCCVLILQPCFSVIQCSAPWHLACKQIHVSPSLIFPSGAVNGGCISAWGYGCVPAIVVSQIPPSWHALNKLSQALYSVSIKPTIKQLLLPSLQSTAPTTQTNHTALCPGVFRWAPVCVCVKFCEVGLIHDCVFWYDHTHHITLYCISCLVAIHIDLPFSASLTKSFPVFHGANTASFPSFCFL